MHVAYHEEVDFKGMFLSFIASSVLFYHKLLVIIGSSNVGSSVMIGSAVMIGSSVFCHVLS